MMRQDRIHERVSGWRTCYQRPNMRFNLLRINSRPGNCLHHPRVGVLHITARDLVAVPK